MSTEMASKYPVNKKKTKGVRDSNSISLQQTSDSGGHYSKISADLKSGRKGIGIRVNGEW